MTIKVRSIYPLDENDLDRELSNAISSEMSRKAWEAICGIINRMQVEIDELREQVAATATPVKKTAAKADAGE